MSEGTKRKNIHTGLEVSIVLKQDQRTEKLTKGIVKDEKRLITFCSMCYHTLKEATLFMANTERLQKINDFYLREKGTPGGIQLEYTNGVQPMDFLEVLREVVGYEKINEMVEISTTIYFFIVQYFDRVQIQYLNQNHQFELDYHLM